MKKRVFIILFIILSCSVSAATLNVGTGQQYSTIQSAVNAANSGDTIKVRPGTYHETVTISKSDITIEAYDPNNPPELDGADQNFNPSWTNVQGKIYKTTYNLPFAHRTPEKFTQSSSGGTGHMGDPVMTLYEDDIWLRGYEGLFKPKHSYPYKSLADLDPSTDAMSDSKREIRIPGRFWYDDSANQLYVWTAKEHGEDHPNNHEYHIPVLKNLVIIKAPRVTLRNLVIKHSYYYAVYIEDAGDGSVIENCYVVNTGPFAIKTYKAENVKILNNFIQLKGFYERQDYISVRYNILKGFLVLIDGSSLTDAKNCDISGNIVSGTYNLAVYGQGCKVHDNIVSKSQSILILPDVPGHLTPKASPGYIHNVKVYNNIFHHADFSVFTSYNTWTTGLNQYYGPLWFYRNVIYAVPQINKDGCSVSPCDSTPDTFIYHNTIVLLRSMVHNPYDYPVRKSTVYRNNIAQFRNRNMEMYWIYSGEDPNKGWDYFPFDNGPDTDYNLYWRQTSWSQIARFRYKADVDAGIYQSYKVGEFSKMQSETKIDVHTREADPKFVNGNEFASANVYNVNYDQLSNMNYKDVIAQGYENIFNQEFKQLYDYFNVNANSPAIDTGQDIPSSWPDTVIISDGKPDIGAVEYGADTCSENWVCDGWSAWSTCVDYQQTRTRTCTDSNGCSPVKTETETQSCNMPTTLVSHWKLDEGNGLSAGDSVGNNDGVISGATWTSDSKTGGNAIQFDGADDYIEVANDVSLNPNYVTVTLWFKPIVFVDNTGIIAKGDTSNRQYWIWTYENSLSLEFDEGTHHNYIHGLTGSTWYHLAVTYDGSNVITYIDGNEVNRISQNTGSILTDTDPLFFGKLPGYASINGIIDDIRIYNGALSSQEINDIFNSVKRSCGGADKNTDGQVLIDELVIYISDWKVGTVGISEIMLAIGEWKNGCS